MSSTTRNANNASSAAPSEEDWTELATWNHIEGKKVSGVDGVSHPMSSTPMVSDGSENDTVQDQQEKPTEQLSPRSRRRRKNRDQMRQARQREREMMQNLRDTMHRLETRYNESVARGVLPAPPTPPAVSDQYYASQMVSPSQYVKLLDEGARLKDENFHFRRTLHEKNKFQETLERLYGDFHQPLTQEEMNDRRTFLEGDLVDDVWAPLTDKEVWAHIRTAHSRFMTTLQAISQRAAARNMDPTFKPFPSFLGWQVQYHREDDALVFSFEKPFYHVTTMQAMQQTWENERGMQSYRGASDLATQSMVMLQVINDDTYVFRRRLRIGSHVVITHYMRFRLKTNTGYAIGHCTVDKKTPPQEGEEGQVWAANLSLWTSFDPAWSDASHKYCVVRISGRTNVDATENAATRAAVDIMFGLLRWENLNIGPVFSFTAA